MEYIADAKRNYRYSRPRSKYLMSRSRYGRMSCESESVSKQTGQFAHTTTNLILDDLPDCRGRESATNASG